MFISRVELLPEDETTAEHAEAKRIEAQLIENDRTMTTDGEPGLFKGAFCRTQPQYNGPIRDHEDGVLRCPRCTWEMEDGECGQCGYATDGEDFSDDDDDDDDGDTIESRSVISIPSSATEADARPPRIPPMNDFLFPQSRTADEDFQEWMRRDREARRGRRASRERRRGYLRARGSPTDTEAANTTMMEHYHDELVYGNHSGDDEDIVAFLQRHQPTEDPWDVDNAEDMEVDEDEDMTSAADDEDGESTTSFHRAAIHARDRGMNPPFESDLSTNASETGAEDETTPHPFGSDSDDTTDSHDSDTPEPTPTTHRLASRPARVVIDSDDESNSDSSSSEEEENMRREEDEEGTSNDSSSEDDDPASSPPRPAAVRQARVQMHRNRRGNEGVARGRGRPRRRN